MKLPAVPLSNTSLLKIHKKNQLAGAREKKKKEILCCNLREIIFAYKVELPFYFNSRASCFTSYFLICATAQP